MNQRVTALGSGKLREEAMRPPSWDLTLRQLCDIELLLNGACYPLQGFLTKTDYLSVCERMRLADGTLWPIPLTLDINEELARSLSPGDKLALRHPEGLVLAVLTVKDIWKPDVKEEAKLVYGATAESHPGIWELFHRDNPVYVGGSLEGLECVPHHPFKPLWHTPTEVHSLFQEWGWKRILAFQTRALMHRAHVERTKRVALEADGHLLLQAVVGCRSFENAEDFIRIRCCQLVLNHYPESTAALNLLPLATRWAGPREALWHAIIHRNYGCTHFIVEKDHASPEQAGSKNSFYPSYAAQELAQVHEEELGICILTSEEMVYVEDLNQHMPLSHVPAREKVLSLSDAELHHRLSEGHHVPEWFSYPEVVAELQRCHSPKAQQGVTIFFTGLSGAGKSTIANVLAAKFMEMGSRPVTLLDGDIVRKHLSTELGFSRRDRDLNILRIGFVAKEITKNRGIAICAAIAPYKAAREQVREMIRPHGGFFEVYVATPLEVCEARDRKGLYRKARAGLIQNFTGIDDPYEPPEKPEVIVDTSKMSAEDTAQQILRHLQSQGFLNVQ